MMRFRRVSRCTVEVRGDWFSLCLYLDSLPEGSEFTLFEDEEMAYIVM